MKHLKLTLLSVTVFAFSALQAQTDVTAMPLPTAEEIIARHVDAVGGIDAWRKVTSIKMEGSMYKQGFVIFEARTVLHQKGFRQDISGAGLNGYIIITPTAGWTFMPFLGINEPEPATEEDVKEGQSALDAQDELVDYKEKGTTVELAGKDDVDGTECFKLLVTFKTGKTKTLFIDSTSYYTIRQVAKRKVFGEEVDFITNFSNYQKLPEGITVAMVISGPTESVRLSKVEVNKPVDEAMFAPPK